MADGKERAECVEGLADQYGQRCADRQNGARQQERCEQRAPQERSSYRSGSERALVRPELPQSQHLPFNMVVEGCSLSG